MAENAYVECECPYCNDMYDNDLHRPRLLKCGHDICNACLLQLHDTMQGRGARCPVCREVDRTLVDRLPTVFKLIPDQTQTTRILTLIVQDFSTHPTAPSDHLSSEQETSASPYILDDTIRSFATSLNINSDDIITKGNQRLWLIDGVTEKTAAKTVISSPQFLIEQPGFTFQTVLFLHGFGSGENTHVSGYVRICRGEFDGQLQWPCPYTFTLEIVDMDNPTKLSAVYCDIGLPIDGESVKPSFMKPASDFNTGRGKHKLCLQSEAFSNRFCRDNKILVRVTIANEKYRKWEISDVLGIRYDDLTQENQSLWLIDDAIVKRKAKGNVFSQQFVTGRPGYKFQLTVSLSGQSIGKKTHVSAFLSICRGEFDAQLQWPCPYVFILEIVDLDNPTKLSPAHCELGWPVDGEAVRQSFMKPVANFNKSRGKFKLYPQSEVFTRRFCRSDKILIRVTYLDEQRKTLDICRLLNLRDESLAKPNQRLWLIDNVSVKTSVKGGILSTQFLTGHPGYKFQAQFYLSGELSRENTHVSGFVRICRGEFDKTLLWPCPYTFTVEIVDLDNPRQLSAAHFEAGWPVSGYSTRKCFLKPESDLNNSIGDREMLLQSVALSKKFCRDDKILIIVSFWNEGMKIQEISQFLNNRFEDFAKPNQRLWLIDDVSVKRKIKGDICSPQFLTATPGYKFQVQLYLNGNRSGENSHVSCYLRICKGEFDSKLEWPCSKDFRIEFVNLDIPTKLSEYTFRTCINTQVLTEVARKCFRKPVKDFNPGRGQPKFLLQSEAFSGRFCRNDKILIRITL